MISRRMIYEKEHIFWRDSYISHFRIAIAVIFNGRNRMQRKFFVESGDSCVGGRISVL